MFVQTSSLKYTYWLQANASVREDPSCLLIFLSMDVPEMWEPTAPCQQQGNPDVPTDPASTAITAILFLRICFFCYAVSTKFLLLRKSLHCFEDVSTILLLLQSFYCFCCFNNVKETVNQMLKIFDYDYIWCKSDVHFIGIIICINQMWKFIWLENYKM